MKRILLLFALLCVFLGRTQVVTAPILYATEDAQTSSGSPSTNYATLGTMDVSKTSASIFRSFLKFNLSTIPANVIVTSAVLSLTPSGTEGITAANQLYLDVCNTSWTEAGITHASNISNNTLFPTLTGSNWNISSQKREFIITDFVQAIVDGRLPNQGWRIRKSDETVNASNTYYTREDANQSNWPKLAISYYIRPYVNAATIVHATGTSSDGSISPTILNGSSLTRYYQWYNSSGAISGATNLNVGSLSYGWYGLKSWGGALGDTLFQAFIVGKKCEDATITFDPGPNYIDDNRSLDLIQGSGTTVVNYTNITYPNNSLLTATRWTFSNWYNERALLRFRLWVDPGCQVNSANMTLTGNGHSPSGRTNESELALITSQWYENGVAFYNAPTSTATGKINIAALPAGNSNITTNIAGFFNTWRTDNLANYGMVFQLQSYVGNILTRMQFNSSDATTASLRPKIDLSVQAIGNCNLTSYSALKELPDAGYTTTNGNTLKFFFTEEYTIDSGKKLPMKIFNEDNIAIAGIDLNGSAISGLTLLPAISYTTDKNFVSLSLSGLTLTTGKFYTLEFTNTLGEKKYLKFKYTN